MNCNRGICTIQRVHDNVASMRLLHDLGMVTAVVCAAIGRWIQRNRSWQRRSVSLSYRRLINNSRLTEASVPTEFTEIALLFPNVLDKW
jgi:hypothetical protein